MAEDLSYLIDSDGRTTSENSAINEFEYIYGGGDYTEVPFAVNVKWVEQTYATAGQLVFQTTKNVTNADIYLNGSLLSLGVDYTIIEPDQIVLIKAAALNDIVVASGGEALPASSLGDKVTTVESVNQLIQIDTTLYQTAILEDCTQKGIFTYDATKSTENDGGLVFNGWVRQFSGAVNMIWFGNDDVALQKAIDYASTIVSGTTPHQTTTAAVFIPSGEYTLNAKVVLKDGVSIFGESVASTKFLISHSDTAMGYEFVADYFANSYLKDFALETSTSAIGIHVFGCIRNTGLENIKMEGFDIGIKTEESWTSTITNCFITNSLTTHILLGDGTGGLHIYRGRYDVAGSYGVHCTASAAELIMDDVAVQFGQTSAVKVDDCRTVSLRNCFFEGNCIGNPSNYYVELDSANYSLNTAKVDNCVMNNLGDSNRNGLGALYFDNFPKVEYYERWVRNDVSRSPVFGDNIGTASLKMAGANDITTLANTVTGSKNLDLQQLARPRLILGEDMTSTTFAPNTRAVLNVGSASAGVAVGSYEAVAALQAYGASYVLQLNKHIGDIQLGSGGAYITSGTQEMYGSVRLPTTATGGNTSPTSGIRNVVVDCSGGGRSIDLLNIAPDYGTTVLCTRKDSGTTNVLNITSSDGALINGVASGTFTTTEAYKTIVCVGDNSGWIVS